MTSTSATSPDELELVGTIRPTTAAPRRWLVVSIAAFAAFSFGFGAVYERLVGTTLEPITLTAASPRAVLAGTVALVVLLGLVVVPHELLHGLCLARYGGDPAYGVGGTDLLLARAYASSEGGVYTRNQLLVAVLAPFVVISAVGVGLLAVLESPLLILPLAANAAGSVADLRTAALLVRYPADVRVAGLAEGEGLGVYGTPSGAEPVRVPLEDGLVAAVVGAAGTLTLVFAGLFATVAASLVASSGTVAVGDPTGPWYRFLFRHELLGSGASLEFGVPAIASLSIGGGLAWAAVVAARNRLGR